MSFTCPECGKTSHHPKDEEHSYCGACHKFFGGPFQPAPLVWRECERCHREYEVEGSMVKQENGNYRCHYCDGFRGVVAW